MRGRFDPKRMVSSTPPFDFLRAPKRAINFREGKDAPKPLLFVRPYSKPPS